MGENEPAPDPLAGKSVAVGLPVGRVEGAGEGVGIGVLVPPPTPNSFKLGVPPGVEDWEAEEVGLPATPEDAEAVMLPLGETLPSFEALIRPLAVAEAQDIGVGQVVGLEVPLPDPLWEEEEAVGEALPLAPISGETVGGALALPPARLALAVPVPAALAPVPRGEAVLPAGEAEGAQGLPVALPTEALAEGEALPEALGKAAVGEEVRVGLPPVGGGASVAVGETNPVTVEEGEDVP
jgi:hypothetical protein